MKKKIIVIGSLPPPVGGMETIMEEMMKLKFRKIKLICMNTSKTKLIKSNKIINFINFIYRCLKLFFLIIIYKPKLIHIHVSSDIGFWQKAVYSKISKILSIKTLLHMHGGRFEEFYNDSNKFKKRIITNVLNDAEAIIVLSEHWRKFYSNITSTKIYTINNPVDFETIKKYHKKTKKTKNIELLYVGRIEKQKGIYELLKAFSSIRNPNIRLNIMGSSTDNYKELNKTLTQLSILNKVQILGVVVGKERYKYYCKSDIFVLPSYWEAMPITILEAMSFGLPIISTNVGSIPEIINKKNGIIIEPKNTTQLKKAILKIINTDREKYYNNNISEIKEKYTLKKFKNNLNKIYETI